MRVVVRLRSIALISLRRCRHELSHIYAALAQNGRAARADSGVSLGRQLSELLLLRAAEGKLEPDDYYKLRLYRSRLSFKDKQKYVSNRAVPWTGVGHWQIVGYDKLLAYSVLTGHGVAIPKILAVCHPLREFNGAVALKTVEDAACYLRRDAPYPIIAKAVRSAFSKDVWLLEGYDPQADAVTLAGAGAASPSELAERCFAKRAGYMFQQLLRPHRAIRDAISDRICTLRIIITIAPAGARLLVATWKIAAGGNVADNYWREGNILARLDQENGTIEQCMTGLGPQFRLVERHPRTGQPLIGFQVPFYREAVGLAKRAALYFPDLRMQAWDIAITDDGPVALEVNVVGSLFIPQLLSQKGLLEGEFRDFARSFRAR